jgi:hypothetical protein
VRDQCVVQRRPSRSPASPSTNAPVQNDAMCAPPRAASAIQRVTFRSIRSVARVWPALHSSVSCPTMHRKILALVGLLSLTFAAAPAFGVTIGELNAGGTYFANLPGTPRTLIHLARPAESAGTVTAVTMMWTGAPAAGCANAAKIKFFRAGSGTISVTAQYGPVNVHNGINTFTIPAVTIARGDWIGVTQLLSLCGGVNQANGADAELQGSTNTDPTTSLPYPDIVAGLIPSIVASSTANVVHGYFIVAGSLRGNANSAFKTSAQLTNLGGSPIAGKLVFHPAGTPTNDSDPSIAYSLAQGSTVSYDDVVQAMGASGLGTIDLVTTSGYPADVSLRIYNDEGAVNGTSGLTEELRTAKDAHHTGSFGSLTIPADLSAFRLNVGIRTLGAGATLAIFVLDANSGQLAHVAERTFAANTFNQEGAAAFAEQTSLPAGGTIRFIVTAGSAFIYGATTDNRTNDPNLRFATRF